MMACDMYDMGHKYYDWHDLFRKLFLKNFGTADMFPA